jgi:hypothetical protein
MVPQAGALFCGDGEVQVGEQSLQWTRSQPRRMVAGPYLVCALGELGQPAPPDGSATQARDAVRLWALLASGTMTSQELQRERELGLGPWPEPSPAARAAALAMAGLPPGQVRAELAPVWERLRAGTLPLSELPGQRP